MIVYTEQIHRMLFILFNYSTCIQYYFITWRTILCLKNFMEYCAIYSVCYMYTAAQSCRNIPACGPIDDYKLTWEYASGVITFEKRHLSLLISRVVIEIVQFSLLICSYFITLSMELCLKMKWEFYCHSCRKCYSNQVL